MSLDADTLRSIIVAGARKIIESAPELTELDQAIGDGDHGANMKRGFEAVLGSIDEIASSPLDEALKTLGMTLVMTVGGASGPLYGSFFLAAGKAVAAGRDLPEDLAEVISDGVNAVRARGRSEAGEKTMLDVLIPVLEALKSNRGKPDLSRRVREIADEAARATAPMLATKGRASFLGERSIGHVDPGARSSCVLVQAICATLENNT